jgi:lantibiotic modifying enzyme
MANSAWAPLLDGALADRAVAAAVDIGRAMAAPDAPRDIWSADASVAQGKAGIALFYALLGEVTGDAASTATADALLDAAIDEVAAVDRIEPALYTGTVGLGWVLSRLEGSLVEPDEGESDADRLVERITTAPWPGHFDLVHGLTGLGVFALERLPRASARASLTRVVEELAALSERTEDGVTWRTTPDRYPARAEQFPDGHFDVGFAHGVPGAVTLLAEAARAGVDGAAALAEQGARWLLAQRATDTGDGAFPGVAGPDGTAEPARLAWCYGDPGVAVALLAAGQALGSAELTEAARATALGCAGRLGTSGVVDASLCHGSAGLGHVFNRLGQWLGDGAVLDVARTWFGHALDHRSDGAEFGGFPTLQRGYAPGTAPILEPAAGFLQGAAGIGLALLSAVTPAAPEWDGILLIHS